MYDPAIRSDAGAQYTPATKLGDNARPQLVPREWILWHLNEVVTPKKCLNILLSIQPLA